MGLCPFLTTADEQVECFSDCAFNTTSKISSDCPFKAIEKDGGFRSKRKSVNYGFKGYGSREEDFFDEDLEFDELSII